MKCPKCGSKYVDSRYMVEVHHKGEENMVAEYLRHTCDCGYMFTSATEDNMCEHGGCARAKQEDSEYCEEHATVVKL